jgi:dihydrofolate reductase
MRPLVLTQNTTLDGRADMIGSWFDDQAPGRDAILDEGRRHRATADALLVGRKTFESFRDYWRDFEGDRTGVARYVNEVTKYVVSSSLTDPGWTRTSILRGDVVEQVTALKAQPGRDIVCTGSVSLSHALLRAGLVDEIRLFVYPVIQGAGRPVLPESWRTDRVRLVEVKDLSGVVLQRWGLDA